MHTTGMTWRFCLSASILFLTLSSATGACPPKVPEPSVSELIRRLQERDRRGRAQAASDLGKLGSAAKEAVHALTKALQDSDDEPRGAAAAALLDIAGTSAVPDIVRAIAGEADTLTQARIFRAMDLAKNQKRAKAAVPALVQFVGDKDTNVRIVATRALGSIGEPGTLDILIKQLDDKDESIRFCTAGALAGFGPSGKSAIPHLVKLLKQRHPDDVPNVTTVHPACISLSAIGASAACPVASILKDPNVPKRARYWAYYCLKMMKPEDCKSALSVLVEVLKDSDPTIREYTFWIFRDLGQDAKDAVPILQEIAKKGQLGDRVNAADALKSIAGSYDPVPVFIQGLRSKDGEVRGTAASNLGYLGPKASASVPALVDAVKDDDPFVAIEALIALDRIGPEAKQAIPALEAIAKDEKTKETLRTRIKKTIKALESK